MKLSIFSNNAYYKQLVGVALSECQRKIKK